RGRRVHEDFRAGAGRLAGHVEQILDADDGAVERTEAHAGTRARIGRVSLEARGGPIDREAGARPLPFGIGDTGKRFFETITDQTRRHDRARVRWVPLRYELLARVTRPDSVPNSDDRIKLPRRARAAKDRAAGREKSNAPRHRAGAQFLRHAGA